MSADKTLTAKQFATIVQKVVREENQHLITREEFSESHDTLTTAVDKLTKMVESYLKQEWNVHIHASHPRLESRITALERKVGIKTA